MDYAVVNTTNNIVENVISLEEGSVWTPPQGFISVPLTGMFGINDTWDGTNFIRFVPPVEVVENISAGVQNVIG